MCNAAESFLIHEAVADTLLPELDTLLQQYAVEIRGCETVCSVISLATEALEQDWYEEYLAPIVAIKVVQSVEEAISHINIYGSHHTDAIVSNSDKTIRQFMRAGRLIFCYS